MDYVTGAYFDVDILGIPSGPVLGASGKFSKVSGLGASFEYEYYNEGGSNVHRAFFKEIKQQTLVLEQGTVSNGDLISFAMNLINIGIDVSFNILVNLRTNTGELVRNWTIVGAHLLSYEGPELDSNQVNVAVSRMEFVYSGAF